MDFNSFWYIGLFILSLGLFLYVYYKKRRPKLFLFLLGIMGFGFLIEAAIYNFLHSYRYYPHLLHHDSVYDSNIGALVSNSFALPVSAVFISVYKKNWLWNVLFAGFFWGIEWLFIVLNIYEHNWWRLEYTFLGLIFVYYPIAKLIYRLMMRPLMGYLHRIILFLIIGPIIGGAHILPIMFFSNRYYELGWYTNVSWDTNAFAAIYYIMMSFIHVLIASYKWKFVWMKYILLPIFVWIWTILLEKWGILHSLVWWDQIYYIVLPIFILFITELISRRLARE